MSTVFAFDDEFMRLECYMCVKFLLYRIPSLNDSDEEHDNGNYEKDVYEIADAIRTEHSEKPKDNQYRCNCCKHMYVNYYS